MSLKNASQKPLGKSSGASALETEWAAANPRPHWTSDFWASTRPDHETEESTE